MKAAESIREPLPLDPSSSPPSVVAGPIRSQKISSLHFERLAVVYVRQSSAHQVLEHRESRTRQYALAEHAQFLGWPEERVLVIDDDQGLSGTTAQSRCGFQRLLAEVTMNHVGLVLALEMSRLARSCKDWHQLFELCGIFSTLLADQEGVYDANDPNDRLLLGLKGIMSEVELQTMRNRLYRGKLNKAQRGELFSSVPRGYVLLPTGEVALDPDEQGRSVVHLVFEKFEEIGSARGVFQWLARKKIDLPLRSLHGPRKGELRWQRPELSAVNKILHHPMYAGVYSFGRWSRKSKRSPSAAKLGHSLLLPIDQWQVLIRDHLPAYISWDQYQRNQERLRQNRSCPDAIGTPRNGNALLAGLLICGTCGRRMQVRYQAADKQLYRCSRYALEGAQTTCFGLTGRALDKLVSRQMLKSLEPAALELSLQVQADLSRERERIDRHWQQNLKRARYEVECAEHRYRAVDPANRLVAATLERQWEQALRQERQLREEYDRSRRQTRPELSQEEVNGIDALSCDIPALWHSPETTNADRQSIVRCLIEKVVLHVERNSEQAEAVIHWAGGYQSRVKFHRPVRRYDQLSDCDRLMKRVSELWEIGRTARQTADILNAEGFVPIKPGRLFKPTMVQDLRSKLGLHNDSTILSSGEWDLRDLAQHLPMWHRTLRAWAVNGWMHARQTPAQKRWIVWADEDEISRLRQLLASHSCGNAGYPPELTTPKPRPDRP